MAHIPYLDPESIPAADQVADHDNILQIHGVHSKLIRRHYDLYRELMYSRGPLSRKQREMIGIVVSARNACHYWVTHHGAGLRRLLFAEKMEASAQDQLLAALEADHRQGSLAAEAALAAVDLVILDYAVKLTTAPATMTAGDVGRLRDAGLNDRAIHDVCAITAYFNFVNRMADGLGVELEEE